MPTTTAKVLLAISAIALALHVWLLIVLTRAGNAGFRMAAQLEIVRANNPGPGQTFGVIGLEWIMILLGVIGAACAVPAVRARRWKVPAIILLGGNAMFVLWHLFTLL